MAKVYTLYPVQGTYYGSSALHNGPNHFKDNWGFGGWGDIYHTYMRFDFPADITGAQVVSAVLNMYANKAVNDPVVNVRRCTSSWDWLTLRSTLLPTEDATSRGAFPSLGGGGSAWVTVDITSLVQDWIDGVSTNFGFKNHSTNGSNQHNGSFSSIWGSNPPYLELTIADIEQEGFRFRNDDGSETTATWKASQDANTTTAKDTPVRLRLLANISNAYPADRKFKLQFKKTTDGTWLDVEKTQ